MCASASAQQPETVLERREKYNKWEKLCAYLGGGYGALILFGDLAKDSFSQGPYQLRATFITLVVAGGVFLGRSAIGYIQAHHDLSVAGGNDQDLVSGNLPYPGGAHVCYFVALTLGALAAVTMMTAAWWG